MINCNDCEPSQFFAISKRCVSRLCVFEDDEITGEGTLIHR
jgi:hypothetical protein